MLAQGAAVFQQIGAEPRRSAMPEFAAANPMPFLATVFHEVTKRTKITKDLWATMGCLVQGPSAFHHV
jgi:hypothetical protein